MRKGRKQSVIEPSLAIFATESDELFVRNLLNTYRTLALSAIMSGYDDEKRLRQVTPFPHTDEIHRILRGSLALRRTGNGCCARRSRSAGIVLYRSERKRQLLDRY